MSPFKLTSGHKRPKKLKYFYLIASTGRSGSSFLANLFSSFYPFTMSCHGRLQDRLDRGQKNLSSAVKNYFDRISEMIDEDMVFFECNPSFLEWLALYYGVTDGAKLYELLQARAEEVRCLRIFRHPKGYCESVLSQPWKWVWHETPAFEKLFSVSLDAFEAMEEIDRIAHSWLMRNELQDEIVSAMPVRNILFEDFFSETVSDDDFARGVRDICEYLKYPPIVDNEKLTALRKRPVNQHNKNELRLTDAQIERVRRVCGDYAGRLGYAG